jgi:hypothetical protein
MAELHLTDIDDEVLAKLQERARRDGTSLEERIRSLLERAAAEEDGASETLRMPPPDRSFRNVEPVEAPGISASELLIRDRRR